MNFTTIQNLIDTWAKVKQRDWTVNAAEGNVII